MAIMIRINYFKHTALSSIKYFSDSLDILKSYNVPFNELTSTTKREKKNKLGVECKKEENIAMWYTQVLKKSEMLEYSTDIAGCYILRPWSYNIWEHIQSYLNQQLKLRNIDNAYFPLFVTASALEREKSHIEGFKSEVVWLKQSKDQIALRPTSEAIMYPYFQKWIQSYRDLPLKVNQWCNIVRWELTDPKPFIRGKEFLWQEGHTAHAGKSEAEEMVRDALEMYKQIYEQLLAVPVIGGVKTESEKFPGAVSTSSIETVIPITGRGLQAATSHFLGQNFSKAFDIQFTNEQMERGFVWQTSWGFSTRSLGAMVLFHGDDRGIVLPPKVAPIQVVMIPIYYNENEYKKINEKLKELEEEFRERKLRVHIDNRKYYRPGWKFNHWELKGVPIRIELGIKDFEQKEVIIVRRDTGKKVKITWNNLPKTVSCLLDDFHENIFGNAKKALDSSIVNVNNWNDFMLNINHKKTCYAPWCGSPHCELNIQQRSKKDSKEFVRGDTNATIGAIKTLNMPFNSSLFPNESKCFACGEPATCKPLWGRSY